MPDQDSDSAWFLAQFKPNSHAIAARNLARQRFRTFLPLHEETRRARGRFVTQLRPLFPGYIFVALDLAQGGWQKVNSTQGVTRLVSLGKTPNRVPDALVDQLMRRCDSDGKLLPSAAFSPGDKVVLTGGPFADFVATVESIAPERRVYVLLDLMGTATRVAVSAAHLQSV
ncbi:MAG: transcriptional activator RfaH [Rhodobacteraceae bacterium]|nr:transcriptional activator RfaH [Paracoccaceae bacterium]